MPTWCPSRTKGTVAGTLSNIVYFGTDTHYHVELDGGGEFIVRHQNSQARRRRLRARRQGGHAVRRRRRPGVEGLMAAAVPAALCDTSPRNVEAQAARSASNRHRLLATPALVIIGIFGVVPLLIIVVYSFLEAAPYGGVVWNFSTDAYLNFLFQKRHFRRHAAVHTGLPADLLALVPVRGSDHRDLPVARLPDCLFHGDTTAGAAQLVGAADHHPILVEPAGAHARHHVHHPRRGADKPRFDGDRGDR